jgi:regulator of PEP synthase PpsR (kinase-PPPase family)
MQKKHQVFLVSDSIGETAKIVFQTALTQFDADDFEMHIFSFVKTVDEIDNIIFQAKQKNASIIYTIVLKSINEHLKRQVRKYGIISQDLLSDTICTLQKISGTLPVNIPGQNRLLDEEYFKRMEAIEFTVQTDDGKSLVRLKETSLSPMSPALFWDGVALLVIMILNTLRPLSLNCRLYAKYVKNLV